MTFEDNLPSWRALARERLDDWKAERERRIKAERERDEARDGARVAFDRCRELEKARMEAVDALYRLRAADPRPLTPDAITDEMVERAQAAAAGFGTAWDISASATFAMLTAALTEPPARDPRAVALDADMRAWDREDDFPDQWLDGLADHLARLGWTKELS